KSAKDEHAKRHNIFYRMSERGFAAVQRGYDRSLRWGVRNHLAIFGLFVASIVVTVYMFRIMPQDFLPTEDTGRVNAATEGANGVSFAEMRRHQAQVEAIVRADPNVAGIMSSVGAG